MAVHRANRQALRERVREGDLQAAVELVERWGHRDVKALLCDVCSLEVPLTPAVFDICADALAMVEERRGLAWA